MDKTTNIDKISVKHSLWGDAGSIVKNREKTILLLNAYDENWNKHQLDGDSLLHKRIVYLHAEDLLGTMEWQWTHVAQVLKSWDEEFSNWLGNNAHRAQQAESLLPAKIEQAGRRGGRCIIVIEQAQLLHTKKPAADWQRLAQLTQQVLVFVLMGDELLRDIKINKSIHTTNCNITDFYLNLNQLSLLFAATGVVTDTHSIKIIYEITQGWTFAALMINALIKHGQPLNENDLNIAVTRVFNAFDADLFPKDAPEQKLAILLSQFEEFTYRMAVEVSPFSENVVKSCFNRLPGIQYKNHGRKIALHPFMRRYLENKLYEIPKKMRDTCLRRAVLWHTGKGEYLPALRYAVLIKDYDNLRIILRMMNVHRCYKDSKTMCTLLSEIPIADLRKHPMIWMYKVLCYFVADEFLLGQEERKMLEAYLALHLTTAEQRQAMGELCALDGFMHFGLPRCIEAFKKATIYIKDASEIWDGRYSDFVANGSSLYYAEETGLTLLETAESLLEIEACSNVLFNNWGRGFSRLGLAEYYYLVGDDLAMLDNANRAIQQAVAYQQWDVASVANYLLTAQHIKEGRFDEGLYAWRNIHQLGTQKKSRSNHLDDLADFTVYCVTGQPYLSAGWIRDDRPQPSILQEFEPGLYLYARCVYTVLQGEHIKALSLIDDALGRSSFRHQWYITSKLNALKMMVLMKLDMIVPACQLLNKFYGMLQKHGCILFLTEFGETLASLEELVKKAKAMGINTPPPGWIQQIIEQGQVFEENKKRFRAAYYAKLQKNTERKLTPREYVALQMSCMGYERKDIALCLEVNTKYVSAIMNKVCSKLQVKNSDAAIVLGRSLGIHNNAGKLLH